VWLIALSTNAFQSVRLNMRTIVAVLVDLFPDPVACRTNDSPELPDASSADRTRLVLAALCGGATESGCGVSCLTHVSTGASRPQAHV
jgi:hypothetical protein